MRLTDPVVGGALRLPDDLADDAEAVARVPGDSVNQLIIVE